MNATSADLGGTVSVVVPIFRARAYIGGCIQSVIAQSFPTDRMQVVLVNNRSDDGSVEVAKSLLAQTKIESVTIHEHVPGAGIARNAGAAAADGDWLQFLDADDVLAPRKIADQIFGSAPSGDVGCIYSDWADCDSELRQLRCRSPLIRGAGVEAAVQLLGSQNFLAMGSHLIRRSAFMGAGGFSASKLIEDVELYIRLALNGWGFEKVELRYPGLLYRRHDQGLSSSDPVGFAEAIARNARLLYSEAARRGELSDEVTDAVSDCYFMASRSLAGRNWAAFRRIDDERRLLRLRRAPAGPLKLKLMSRVFGYRNAERIAALYRSTKTLVGFTAPSRH